MADIKFGVAAEPYPPFSSKDASGKWVGWEIDLMDAVCAQMNEKCELVEVAWDGIIPALQAKQIDVIWSSMSITDERKQTIDFSDMYYNTPTVIIGAKTGDLDITPEHLKGKVIGVQVSTTHENYAQKYFRIRRRRGQDLQHAGRGQQRPRRRPPRLCAGRCVQHSTPSCRPDQGKGCCELKGKVTPDDPETLGAGVGSGNPQGRYCAEGKAERRHCGTRQGRQVRRNHRKVS